MNAKELCFINDTDTYIFRYRLGQELEVIYEIRRLARNPDLSLNKYDVYVLIHNIKEHGPRELSDVINKFLRTRSHSW